MTSVTFDRVHADDCMACEHTEGRIERFTRTVALRGDLDDEMRQRLLSIADRCPVHRTLEGQIEVHTTESGCREDLAPPPGSGTRPCTTTSEGSPVDPWVVYWFMFPVCVVVASAAMFSGISGAAMLMPVFLIGFPLLGVPTLTTVAAVGMSLFLETSGFGTGLYRYLKRGLVDTRMARSLAMITVPAAVLGAVAARWVPADGLRIGYGVLMLLLAYVLLRDVDDQPSFTTPVPTQDHDSVLAGQARRIETRDGLVFRYEPSGMGGQRILSGAGAVLAGLISTGVGEATLPGLVKRSGVPVPVAAATSTVVVAATVAGAALTHVVELAREGGFSAIPWNLVTWAIPGAVLGAILGTRLQGRVPEKFTQRVFAALFGLIGVTFVAVFGLGIGPNSLS